jgi:hypothetical protein
MTSKVVKDFLSAMRTGNPIKTSANYAGVSQQVVLGWIEKGREFEVIPESKRTAAQNRYVNFLGEVEQAQSVWLVRAQTVMFGFLVLPENPTADEKKFAMDSAKFLLTHRDPTNYSIRTQTEVTGKDGGPVELATDVEAIFEIMLAGKEQGVLDE